MAVEDFGGEVDGIPIEVIHGDHRNRADTGASRARNGTTAKGWDMINDLSNPGSPWPCAVADEQQRHAIVNSSSNIGLTNDACSPT
ncbi:hypothetical protein DSL92_02675 [Billgrantia gudaonensis]|uniref:Uncharacterized protein n=1 Tax=Billgrantia gudaonensis TaxID=376427 RepID=A0A432JK20_9GAMM|nr:hypothetical protein DSL92_02675 [Halomonas gudaonensis]